MPMLLLALALLAGDPTVKTWHCEKKDKGKSLEVLDVKSRKECKKAGGKWVKPHEEPPAPAPPEQEG